MEPRGSHGGRGMITRSSSLAVALCRCRQVNLTPKTLLRRQTTLHRRVLLVSENVNSNWLGTEDGIWTVTFAPCRETS